MNAADIETLDLLLISYLAQHDSQFGVPANLLLAHVRSTLSSKLTLDEVVGRLDYQGDATNALGKALVRKVAKLNPQLTRWKLTAAGVEYAQERGLDQ